MKDFFDKIHVLEENIFEDYSSYWTMHKVPKKTIMTRADDTEHYLYYVLDGVQKSYYLADGKEHVLQFAYAPSLSGVVESFLTQTPSKYYLETITASTFLRISYQNHQQLLEKHRSIETLFRKLSAHFLMNVMHRHHELMAYGIEERFKLFVKRSPHLLQMVSQKDLASYLRIDATNFSKLINSIPI